MSYDRDLARAKLRALGEQLQESPEVLGVLFVEFAHGWFQRHEPEMALEGTFVRQDILNSLERTPGLLELAARAKSRLGEDSPS